MTTLMTTASGSRRTLANEIDRLDEILNGLSDNLSEAVGDAVRAATTEELPQAAQQALRAALLDPVVLNGLRNGLVTNPPTPTPSGGRLVRLAYRVENRLTAVKTGLSGCWAWVAQRWADVGRLLQSGRDRVMQLCVMLMLIWPLLWTFRWHVLIAGAVGVLLGLVTLLSNPLVGIVASTLGAFVLTLLVVIRALPVPPKQSRHDNFADHFSNDR
jgi:hypothetical protein